MKNVRGEELIAVAGAASVALSKSMDNEELGVFCELLGLLKHNLEIIRVRRFVKLIEDKKK